MDDLDDLDDLDNLDDLINEFECDKTNESKKTNKYKKSKKNKKNKKTKIQCVKNNIDNTSDKKKEEIDDDNDNDNDNYDLNIISVIKQKKYTIGYDINYETLLSNLSFPFISPNYNIIKQYMKNDLSLEIFEYKNEFTIVKNNAIHCVIHKNKDCSKIPKWFNNYGYNICIPSKTDSLHTFPFILDLLIGKTYFKKTKELGCKHKTINGENYKATCLYFSGKILLNNKMVDGTFEYFIDKNNILFHRFFKPDKVDDKVDE